MKLKQLIGLLSGLDEDAEIRIEVWREEGKNSGADCISSEWTVDIEGEYSAYGGCGLELKNKAFKPCSGEEILTSIIFYNAER